MNESLKLVQTIKISLFKSFGFLGKCCRKKSRQYEKTVVRSLALSNSIRICKTLNLFAFDCSKSDYIHSPPATYNPN